MECAAIDLEYMVRTSPVFTPVLVADVLILDEELHRGGKNVSIGESWASDHPTKEGQP